MLNLIAAFALGLQSVGWTWTLYDTAPTIVLANELPDTPDLRTTLECEAGAGVVKISVFNASLPEGMATVSSGGQTAASALTAGRDHSSSVMVPADYPVFASFLASGRLGLRVADQSASVEMGSSDLAKLRRFADLCGG